MPDTRADRMRELERMDHRVEEGGFARGPSETPSASVAETADEVTITVDLSGPDPDEVDVLLSRDILYVEARLEPRQGGERADREREARTVALPEAVDGSDATASLGSGVLTVMLRKESANEGDDGTWIPVS